MFGEAPFRPYARKSHRLDGDDDVGDGCMDIVKSVFSVIIIPKSHNFSLFQRVLTVNFYMVGSGVQIKSLGVSNPGSR